MISELGFPYHHYCWYRLGCKIKQDISVILSLDSHTNSCDMSEWRAWIFRINCSKNLSLCGANKYIKHSLFSPYLDLLVQQEQMFTSLNLISWFHKFLLVWLHLLTSISFLTMCNSNQTSGCWNHPTILVLGFLQNKVTHRQFLVVVP